MGCLIASDIVRVNVFGTNIVVLNSLEACVELLDQRSAIYSDRCVYTFARFDFCLC